MPQENGAVIYARSTRCEIGEIVDTCDLWCVGFRLRFRSMWIMCVLHVARCGAHTITKGKRRPVRQ